MIKSIFRCGLCDKNFKTIREYRKHFDSKEHKETLANPELMGEKIFQSQSKILKRAMDIEDGEE